MNARGWVHATLRRHPEADIAVAVSLYLLTLVSTAADPSGEGLDPAGMTTAAVACGALVVRRRWPFAVLLVSAVAAEANLFHYHGNQRSLVLAAPLVALYTVADASSRRRALVIGVLVMLALGTVHLLIKPASWIGSDNLTLAALGALAISAGDATRSHRAYLAEAEARVRQAEADREAEAARRVTDERLRIARELHDVLGHQLALIHIQAEVAIRVLTDPPARAGAALDHVRTASKTALAQLGDTVTLLREPGEPTMPTEPFTGLAGADELIAGFRRSGLAVGVRVEGTARPVPAPTDLTAYRVIQESLTNVCKHAGPAAVAVRLVYGDSALQVVVDNAAPPDGATTGPGSPGHATAPSGTTAHGTAAHGTAAHGTAAGGTPRHETAVHATAPSGTTAHGTTGSGTAGHGLVGMRERVTALGGTLRAGPRPDGGYRVHATLPLPARIPT